VVTHLPDTPDYELFDPPFGEGGFGKVWLARNAIGQWQALKAVYQSNFGKLTGPYEAEFKGIERYKPVSEKHPGLLRVDFVSKMKPEGYFYYVMELGDGQIADWQKNPATYQPWDLGYLRAQSPGGRVAVMDCVRIGLALAEALDFLHREGLTHRDIKPSNVIFVNGQPKLADVGLVSDIRTPDKIRTYAGTIGYMPPHPEPSGTVSADIYALGMLLYVVSTGRDPDLFPNLSTTLMERTGHAEFIRLNAIILKACQPDPARRYASAAEMQAELQEAYQAMKPATPEAP
jgi:serine/threonine protein kinase